MNGTDHITGDTINAIIVPITAEERKTMNAHLFLFPSKVFPTITLRIRITLKV